MISALLAAMAAVLVVVAVLLVVVLVLLCRLLGLWRRSVLRHERRHGGGHYGRPRV